MLDQKLIEIKESEIKNNLHHSWKMLESISVIAPKESSQEPRNLGYRSTVVGASISTREKKFSVKESIANIDPDDYMLSNQEHHTLLSLYRAIAISGAVYNLYSISSGLNLLLKDNLDGRINANDRSKLISLQMTSSAISVWVVANYLLKEFGGEKTSSVDVDELEALKLDNAGSSLNLFLYELDKNIVSYAKDEDTLISVIKAVCDKALSKIELQVEGLDYTNYFTAHNYRVEKDNYEISGFSRSSIVPKTELIMNFKKPEEVIGNAVAKYQAQRIAKMIMCYDFDRKMNPFAELGGFIYTFLGDGYPGTGKTTLIQMMAGLINDYCKNVGYPFHYENLSIDSVDSFQGRSARHADQFIKNVTRPDIIGFGTIDDIDQVAGKRGDSRASEGQLGITAKLMSAFAGANTQVLGNSTIGMFTNYPDKVDPALRQRASARFLIDGPKSVEDFTDISALFAGKDHAIKLGNIDLFTSQGIIKAASPDYTIHDNPETTELKKIFNDTLEEFGGDISTLEAIGKYLYNISKVEPKFTGRAVASIFNAANSRMMDFEMPDEWFESPETFLLLPYETKKNMISDLKSPLDARTLLQEVNRYADSEFRYINNSDDAEVEDMLSKHRIHEKYQSKIKNIY